MSRRGYYLRWWLLTRDRLAVRLSRIVRWLAPVWSWDMCPECGKERDPDVPGTIWGACRTKGCSLRGWAQPPNFVLRQGRSPDYIAEHGSLYADQ